MKYLKNYFPAFFTIIFLLLVWEFAVKLRLVSPNFLPTPSSAFQAIYDYRTIISEHTLQTLRETLIGLGLSIFVGIVSGIIIFSSRNIRKAVYPLLVLSQTIPIVALAPLLLLWFGFGLWPKVIVVVLYSFFPIAVAFSDALLQTDEQYIDLLKSMKATKWQTLKYIHIPSSLPGLFSGIRIGTTYAMAGAIVGEFVGAYKGLGIFIQTSANSHAINLVFAALFVIVAVTLTLLTAVSMVERLIVPWKK